MLTERRVLFNLTLRLLSLAIIGDYSRLPRLCLSHVSVFFFPFHLHNVVHFYAADSHECPSVPRGRIIRYGRD